MEKTTKYDSFVGKLIDNRYEVLQVIGIGGMAFVLKAHDVLMNRTVAIKILNDENNSDDNAVRRFVNESKAVAMLSHENIVNVYDVAFDEPLKYIVMEFVDGITLKEYLKEKEKLPWQEAVMFTEQILLALEHAHEKGIIHRDIKPQNMLLLENNKLKVADFGIAKLPNNETLLLNDKAMGTVYYISPEQASGEPTGLSTDIYSVGVMLYEMITGRLPFEGENPLSVAMMQINNEPTTPSVYEPSVPKGLEQIILKAMKKEPENRFKSAHSMLRALSILKNNPLVTFEEKTVLKDIASSDNTPDKQPNDKKEKNIASSKKIKIIKGKRTMFPIILGVTVAFMSVALVFGIFLGIKVYKMQTIDSSVTVSVPNLTGREYSQKLLNELSETNFRISSVDFIYSDQFAADTIVEQTPAQGERKKLSSENAICNLSIIVSLGKEALIMPDYSIEEYRKSILEMRAMGLNPVVENVNHDAVMEGYIINTVPAAGDRINVGDTVKVYVSSGQKIKYSLMCDVIGETLENAKKILVENNFIVGTITRQPSDAPVGTVISQSVIPFKSVPEKYTIVDLVISINDNDTN